MEHGRLAGWGICNNKMGDVMEFVPIIFNIAILSVILWFTWKAASGAFVEKKDLHAMVVEYMLANDVYDVAGLMGLVERNNENTWKNVKKIVGRVTDLERSQPEQCPSLPESPTLQAVESGARIALEAFTLGSKAVLDALTRDGRIAGENQESLQVCEPTNLGEEDYDRRFDNPVLADIIMARNQQAAKQMGETINDDLMKFMDGMGK